MTKVLYESSAGRSAEPVQNKSEVLKRYDE